MPMTRGILGLTITFGLLIGAVASGGAQDRNQAVAGQKSPQVTAIDEKGFVSIGGIEQWVSIQGQNRNNPVVLILHGGPGVSNMPFAAAFVPWQKDFTVVEWDQRGAGRTFGRNGAQGSGHLTVERLVQDGIELTGYLQSHLEKDKVVLLGVSFGSMLGVEMVQARPDLFAAYVGSGQVINPADGDALGYSLTIERARALENTEAVAALMALGPPPWADVRQRTAAKGWATRLTLPNDPAGRINIPALLKALPDFSADDMKNLAGGLAFSTDALGAETTFDARRIGSRFPVPLFIFQGDGDLNTPTELSKKWFDAIEAPAKYMVIVPNASHAAFYTNANELGQLLSDHVRPLVVGTPK